MKTLLILLVAGAAGVGLFLFFKKRRDEAWFADANPRSLRASHPAADLRTSSDFMRDKLISSAAQNLPTIIGGLFPSRWFNSNDTAKIYAQNEAAREDSRTLEDWDYVDPEYSEAG